MDPAHLAIRPEDTVLHVEVGGECPLAEAGQRAVAVLRVDGLDPEAARGREGRQRPAEHRLDGRAGVEQALLLRLAHPDHVVHGVGELAEPRLALGQRRLGALAPGDLHHPCAYRDDGAGGVAHGVEAGQPMARHARLARRLAPHLQLAHRLPGLEHPVDDRAHRPGVFRQQLLNGAADVLGGGDAVGRGQLVIDPKVSVRAVEEGHAERRALQQRLEFRRARPQRRLAPAHLAQVHHEAGRLAGGAVRQREGEQHRHPSAIGSDVLLLAGPAAPRRVGHCLGDRRLVGGQAVGRGQLVPVDAPGREVRARHADHVQEGVVGRLHAPASAPRGPTRGRGIQAAEDVEQGGFPGTRRAEQHHELAPADVEVEVAQRMHRDFAAAVALAQAARDEDRRVGGGRIRRRGGRR